MLMLAKITLRLVALFYAYGAAVHILNIASLTGFDWLEAPVKWQVLDVFYLIVDVIVAVGLFLSWRIAIGAFYVAAISQIFLYTVFREWILNVPEEFSVSAEQNVYLDYLVIFHITTVVLVSFALRASASNAEKASAIPER